MEKIAVIELAEASTILTIYETQNGRSRIIRHEEDAANISVDINEEKLLRPKTISDIVTILKLYREVIETSSVTRIIAVANNLIMKARNQRGFFEEIFNNTGIGFTFLSDEDVVKYTYTSVTNKIDNSKGVIFYVAPYVTRLVKYNRRTSLGFETIPFGYENITECGANFEEMKKFFLTELKNRNFSYEADSPVVGVGNAFINFGRIAKKVSHYPIELDNNYPISFSEAKATINFVNSLDLEKITKVKGLMEDRSDVLVSGFAIISALWEHFKVGEIVVSTASVRDGIITNAISSDVQERFSDLLGSSFDNIHEFDKDEFSKNLRVANMAGILFKQLKVMHKLPRTYVKPMRIAAYMFDCGKKVSFNDYEKHGFYVILNSGLCGATQKELLLGAFICECQSADNFNLSKWIKYKDLLNDEDLGAVRKLGVIVKLAVALNSSKKQVVGDVVCDILGDSVIMKTIVTGDPTYELIEGMKVAKDYRKFFKKNLQLI